MENCQKDGIKVVATERNLSTANNEFGKKKKSMYQQRRLTKYTRRIKQLSNFKEKNIPKYRKFCILTR